MRWKPKIVRLKKPKVDPASTFISALVWLLNAARAGKILGYALVVTIRNDDGSTDTTGCADVYDSEMRLHGLGMIRRLENNFIKREWPEDSAP